MHDRIAVLNKDTRFVEKCNIKIYSIQIETVDTIEKNRKNIFSFANNFVNDQPIEYLFLQINNAIPRMRSSDKSTNDKQKSKYKEKNI